MNDDITQEQETVQEDQSPAFQIEGLQLDLQTEKDKALRAMAELENFKRRKEQEVETFKKYAQEKAILELLPVLDSFDRACDYVGEDLAEKVKGFLMIQKQFHAVLEKLGVICIDAANQPFDPALHQAVMEEAAEGVPPGMVVRDMQKGYKLHDRVIRPSMAVVSK